VIGSNTRWGGGYRPRRTRQMRAANERRWGTDPIRRQECFRVVPEPCAEPFMGRAGVRRRGRSQGSAVARRRRRVLTRRAGEARGSMRHVVNGDPVVPATHVARIDELKATGQLPSPTGVAMAILRLTQSDKASARDIAEVLESDPALAGRILKHANSASVGASRPAVAVADAVVRLGLRTVRQLALGFSLVSKHQSGPCRGFDYQDFWSRSLAAALGVQALSRQKEVMPPAEAFTVGLLSQIGRLGLASVHPDSYSRILEQCKDNSRDRLIRLEREQFAIDHNELSAALLQDWGLPALCVDAVRYYEVPEEGDLQEGSRPHRLTRLLHVATHLAGVCVADDDERDVLATELVARGQAIGIDSEALATLCDEVVRDWREWGEILHAPTREVPFLKEMLERARQAGHADESEQAPSSEAKAISLRILAVDDSELDLKLLTKYLTSAGHKVVTASDGREGLRMALETDPGMIITDWIMPEMEGPEFCRALRRSEKGRQIYVIMLTGCEDEGHLVEAFEAGADDFIVKPYNPKALMARIRAAQRIITLQKEVDRDKEQIRRYVAALGVANRKLEQAALTDELTGLPNRRYALDRLGQEWAAATRSGRALTCLSIDIDHFKNVNDTCGHDTGDAVLRETAAALKRAMRKSDVVCRFGGEEFVAICPETHLRDATQLAERLRTTVEANIVSAGTFDGGVQVSVGVAERDATMPNPDALLKAADQALYAAKQAGRNRVCQAGKRPSAPAAHAT